MALFRVQPTRADVQIAQAISEHTTPRTEAVAQTLTWGADEHVLCALAALWWLYCRTRGPRARRDSNHFLLTTMVATVVPHVLKTIFDQKRPDRLMIRGHLRGVPFSGKSLDAFPSGHAIHIGALASAATVLRPAIRNLLWACGAGLVLTRVVLLAHWMSDVVAGLAIGALIERLLRLCTGYASDPRHQRQGVIR